MRNWTPPSDRTLNWLRQAATEIEIHADYTTQPEQWRVLITNGLGGHAGAGSIIATCTTQEHARVVALALETLVIEELNAHHV